MTLRVDGVRRSFGGVTAVDGVSLALAEGARHVVFGPNGAGKTTLFRLICGELPTSAGRIALFGSDCTRLSVWRRARLGLGRTFQVSNLFPELTARECLVLACQSGARVRRTFWRPWRGVESVCRRADALLESTGLGDHAAARVRELSYGDQRLLEIAMAMASRPRLLLLDEPTAGLSHSASRRIVERIAALPEDVTLLLIEHNLDVAFELSRTATVLHFGRVVRHGPVEHVRADPAVQQLYLGAP